jgi:hypothetical protein
MVVSVLYFSLPDEQEGYNPPEEEEELNNPPEGQIAGTSP